MADFLTRLAGRTLGLVPTVQPSIAPIYAPGQQFEEAVDAQEGIQEARGAINRAMDVINRASPAAEYDRREMSLQDGLPNESPPGNLVGQTVHAQEMFQPLVPQENKPSIMPIQSLHPASKTPDGRPVTWQRISLKQDQAEQVSEREHDGRRKRTHPASSPLPPLREESEVGQDGQSQGFLPHPAPPLPLREESEVGHDGRRKRSHPTSTPLPPLHETQGRPLEATLVPPVADVLLVQRPAETKVIRSSQDTSQVGRLGHPYDQGNQNEFALVAQELSAPVPTIQVTIGRIEVRAMPNANPPHQPRRSEPPVMGLEEYLNQRAKGGY